MTPSDDRRKAGFFLLLSLGLLVATAGTLAGIRFLRRDRTFIAEFRESVAGLEVSSPVKYKGVPVGQVSAIRFHPTDISRIQVEFKVRPEVPMKFGTEAELAPQGITGIFYLELDGGMSGAEDLDDGAVLASKPSLTSKIGSIAENLSEVLDRVNRFIAANEADLTYAIRDFRASAGSIRATLEKVDRAVGKGEQAVDDVLATIAELRTEVKSTGEAVRRAVGEAETFLKDPDLRGIPGKADRALDLVNERIAAADLKGLIDRAAEAVAEFRRIEGNLDRAVEALSSTAAEGRRDVAAALANIRTASEHVKEATRLLKDDPGRLLRSSPPAEKPIPDPLPPLPEDRR